MSADSPGNPRRTGQPDGVRRALTELTIVGVSLVALAAVCAAGAIRLVDRLEAYQARRHAEPDLSDTGVAANMREGLRLFAEDRHVEAAARFYRVEQLDPGNPDAERMGYLSVEFLVLQQMDDALRARAPAPER